MIKIELTIPEIVNLAAACKIMSTEAGSDYPTDRIDFAALYVKLRRELVEYAKANNKSRRPEGGNIRYITPGNKTKV